MTPTRYQPGVSRPASAGASLLLMTAVGFALTLVGPTLVPKIVDPTLIVDNIPIEPPPRPVPPRDPAPAPAPARDVRTIPQPHQPAPVVPLPPMPGAAIDSTPDPTPIFRDPPATFGPAAGGAALDPPRAPVMVDAAIDPRFADAFQPPYPDSEIRAETEGVVTARVRIGVDGRVKAIEILRSPSDGLAAATRRHALSRWRFKPATRDDIPVESWKVVTLRFRLVD